MFIGRIYSIGSYFIFFNVVKFIVPAVSVYICCRQHKVKVYFSMCSSWNTQPHMHSFNIILICRTFFEEQPAFFWKLFNFGKNIIFDVFLCVEVTVHRRNKIALLGWKTCFIDLVGLRKVKRELIIFVKQKYIKILAPFFLSKLIVESK